MKPSVIILLVLCGAIVGAAIYFNHPKAAPVVQAPSPATTEPAPASAPVARQELPPPITVKAAPAAAPAPVPAVAAPEKSNPIGKSVDGLLGAKNGAQKHELFQELVKAGQIDDVIAELKQRAMDNTNDPEIPTTLGEALLNKVRALHEAGGENTDDIGILAMQADQAFNAALKIDPQNWEAQFVKAASMYYWPASERTDDEVVQGLSGLIDQQENMPSQPDFAQTYLVLGNEYEKIGQPDKAMATWQLGAQKFPNDPSLQAKLNGQ